MKKKLFTILALLLTVATGTWAQSLYVAEITADMVAGWENDETPLPTTDLPGFKPATYEEVSAWTGAPTSGHTYLFYNHGDGGYGCFEYQDGVKSQEGSDNSERRHIYNRVTGGDKVYYTCSYNPNGPDFNLNGTLDHGTIAFTVYGNAATTAKAGQTVTVTVIADEGYTVQSITGEWASTFEAAHSRRRTPALTTIPVLGDIALTPVDGQENTWTFTMEAANATFSATFDAIPYTVSLAEGTADADKWTIDPAEAKTTGVVKGTEITATYSGTKRVKSVKAVKKPEPKLDLATVTEATTVEDGYTVFGTLGANVKISIADGATVTLDGVTIPNGQIACSGNATIILMGANAVTGANAAIKIGGSGTTLTITGSGSLTAQGGWASAGIGTDSNGSGGNIVINGGTVTATGGMYGAGIGTGNAQGGSNTCGDITINGGTVTAQGGSNAAGIGTGISSMDMSSPNASNNTCGAITIGTGVTMVTATKGSSAPNSIGKGKAGYGTNQACGTITIGGDATTYAAGVTESPFTYPTAP